MAAHPHHNDDLDQLLDSALDDFHNLNLNLNNPSLAQRSKEEEEEEEEEEEKEEEKQEDRPSSGVQGLGLGLRLPDLKAKTKTKTKTETKLGRQKAPPSNEYFHVSEALNQLRTQTREAVKGLESLTSSDADDPSIDDWVKQFEHLAGSQDMESIMETMMQQLLSKEILYEPMKEIGERYPKWLADHKASLSKEELERFSHQYELIKDLNQVYEKEPTNFNKIVELMQKMQECGQPPNDILHQLAPDFDLASLGQISPEMLESQANCCIM